jgi:tetratricopeptide (TPR) repeat protein
VSIRAEYASALIQARRYQEAAAEYRRLLQQQPSNFEWRLNYARALEWGGNHRAAEAELRRLSARAPRNATVESLLREARASIEPTAREATRWVAERPNYTPYRLALARALVRERRPRASFPYFDAVLARDASPALFGEAADAHAAAGDRAGAIDLYRRAVERSPSDAALRRSYAQALAANRQYAAAIEIYNALPNVQSDPKLLAERGELFLRNRNPEAAERDLSASIAIGPTPEVYTLLGDLYRWGGQFQRSRAAYEQALQLQPAYRRAGARLAQLTREERPPFGFASLIDEGVGVTVATRTVTDNTGFAYVSGETRVGFPVGPETVLGIGLEPRVVYDGSPPEPVAAAPAVRDQIAGVAASVGVAHTFRAEDVDVRIAGRGGGAAHNLGGATPLLSVGGVATYRGAWSISLEGAVEPAYANLMALALTEGPSFPGGSPSLSLVMSRTFAVAATAPVGLADLAALYETMALSDGNVRSAFEASVRVPLVAGLSLLYSGGSLSFAERSALYWDPPQYVSHSFGLELGLRNDRGFEFTARLLPGVARTVEGLTPGDPARFGETEPGLARFVGQLAANADLGLRSKHWQTLLAAAFGTGRGGGYQQFHGSLRVRYIP